ncbi:MAG: hypothetical protein EZS28_004002, partial [Streblomastix strix]
SAAYLQKLVSKAGKPSRETPSRQRFDEQDERVFIAELIERFNQGSPSILSHLWNEVTEKYCKSREETRMNVIMEDVNNYRGELDTKIVRLPNWAVWALDECGAQDWPDAKPMLMLVPSSATEAQCFYIVKRNGALHSVLLCINLSGERIIPLIVTMRKTLNAEVAVHGLRINIDIVIMYVKKKYVIGELMNRFLREIYVPSINNTKAERNANSSLEDQSQAAVIARLLSTTKSAITPSKNRAAFSRAGIDLQIVGGALVACMVENEWNIRVQELIHEDD